MGLRDHLLNLNPGFDINQVLQASQGFNQAAQGLRQQQANQDYANQAPGLLSDGSPEALGQLAGLDLARGGSDVTDLLVKQKSAQSKAKETEAAIPDSAVDVLNIPQSQKNEINAIKDPKLKQAVLSFYQKNNTEVLGQQKEKQTELKNTQAQRQSFANTFDKSYKELQDQEQDLQKVKSQLAQGTQPADNVANRTMLRILGSDKRVTDRAVLAFINDTFGGDVTKATNFFTNSAASKLQPNQRKALNSLLVSEANNIEANKADVLGGHLNNAVSTFPSLIDANGKPDKAIVARAKQAGFTVVPNQDGTVSFQSKGQTRTLPSDMGGGGGGVDVKSLYTSLNGITDPTLKKQAQDQLENAINNKTLTPELVKKFKLKVQQFSGGVGQ